MRVRSSEVEREKNFGRHHPRISFRGCSREARRRVRIAEIAGSIPAGSNLPTTLSGPSTGTTHRTSKVRLLPWAPTGRPQVRSAVLQTVRGRFESDSLHQDAPPGGPRLRTPTPDGNVRLVGGAPEPCRRGRTDEALVYETSQGGSTPPGDANEEHPARWPQLRLLRAAIPVRFRSGVPTRNDLQGARAAVRAHNPDVARATRAPAPFRACSAFGLAARSLSLRSPPARAALKRLPRWHGREDTPASEVGARKGVWVQVPPAVPISSNAARNCLGWRTTAASSKRGSPGSIPGRGISQDSWTRRASHKGAPRVRFPLLRPTQGPQSGDCAPLTSERREVRFLGSAPLADVAQRQERLAPIQETPVRFRPSAPTAR